MRIDHDSGISRRWIPGQAPIVAGAALASAESGEKALVEVKTRYGVVRGIQGKGVATFRGIP